MKRTFTIDLEFNYIDSTIDKMIMRVRENVYIDDTSELTASGAQRLLNDIPGLLYKHCSGIIKTYSDIIRNHDIDMIHEYILGQQERITSITSPNALEPSTTQINDLFLDDTYASDYKTLLQAFNSNVEVIRQRLDNDYLRLRSKRKYEFWIPTSISLGAIAISVCSILLK